MKSVRLLLLPCSVCLGLSSVAVADLGIPGGLTQGSVETLGDGLVRIDWIEVGSVRTPVLISPQTSVSPKIMPDMTTEAEAEARTAEFIDAHEEIFHVSAADLSPLQAEWYTAPGKDWIVNGGQVHGGIYVYGGFVKFVLTNEGKLLRIVAKLYPSADLHGVSLDPTVGKEQALSFSLAAVPYPAVISASTEPKQAIVFRLNQPVLAWQVLIGDSRFSNSPPSLADAAFWEVWVAGDSGEILEVVPTGNSEEPPPTFMRGDANRDNTLNIADPTFTLGYLFLGEGNLICREAADSNDDSRLDLADAVYSLSFLFTGGRRPAAPYPYSGPDPTPDTLGCQQ